MTSYSQNGEDLIIAELFEHSAFRAHLPGKLLDIGAWHPKEFSNSRLLIEQGWGGILVEPSPGPVRELVREYNKWPVQIISALLTVEDDSVREIRVTDDGVSTTNENIERVWAESGGYYGRLHLPTLPLAKFWTQFGGEFDFVSIDTEGSSVDLAIAYLAGPRPGVMCVEHNGRIVELMNIAQSKGYRLVHANQENVILSCL